jgi:hypothetical protein
MKEIGTRKDNYFTPEKALEKRKIGKNFHKNEIRRIGCQGSKE